MSESILRYLDLLDKKLELQKEKQELLIEQVGLLQALITKDNKPT